VTSESTGAGEARLPPPPSYPPGTTVHDCATSSLTVSHTDHLFLHRLTTFFPYLFAREINTWFMDGPSGAETEAWAVWAWRLAQRAGGAEGHIGGQVIHV